MSEAVRSRLTVTDHSRTSAGLRYIYPVVSRRAGGVSVGINLNTNNACNWRCIYCQVPDLVKGAPPPIDMEQLRRELLGFLEEVIHGDFLTTRVPAGARRLNDIALSGNGEPTSAKEFSEVINLIGEARDLVKVPERVKTVLITNGSLMHRVNVQRGVKQLARLNGEIWFKIDRATDSGIRLINNARVSMSRVREHLAAAARLCPTWIQTCLFALDGQGPDDRERQAYLDFVRECLRDGIALRGVLLYGLARQSFQPEASRLTPLPPEALEHFAQHIRALGLDVKVTP